jgi:hypothetical protein
VHKYHHPVHSKSLWSLSSTHGSLSSPLSLVAQSISVVLGFAVVILISNHPITSHFELLQRHETGYISSSKRFLEHIHEIFLHIFGIGMEVRQVHGRRGVFYTPEQCLRPASQLGFKDMS